jgi:acetyl-CoA carboxylase biotin carboxyl carrier protein
MDHGDPTTDGDPAAGSTEATLAAVRHSALELLASFPRPPATLRVQAGDVTVEATWGGGPAPEAPAAAGPDGVTGPAGVTGTAGAETADGTNGNGTRVDEDPARRYLRAPTVGSFYRAPEPGARPFVDVGDLVTAGQQVAIVEAMKLMIPVRADTDGTVVEVLKDDGAPVEHGEPLFALGPAGP